tara:strand:- start:302 stop:727 length:426 start_codon:yes stop_codon:yes gene_type:complete
MKKLKSPNSYHFIFFLIVVADVFFLYNLIQYIRYGLDTNLNGFIFSLAIGIILLVYLWKNNYFPKQYKPVTNQISKNEPTNKMKRFIKKYWIPILIGGSSPLINYAEKTFGEENKWYLWLGFCFSILLYVIIREKSKAKNK